MQARDPWTAQIGKEILPLDLGYLPEYFQKKAEIELYETPEKRVRCVQQLKEKATREKLLKGIDFDDEFLLQHLRAKKFDINRAFLNLKSFVNYTRSYPQIFTDLEFEVTVKVIKDNIITVLPWRCQDGCAIVFLHLDNWNPEEFPLVEVKRMLVVYIVQTLLDPMTQVNGFKAILDVKSSSLRFVRYCTPQNLYMLIHGIEDCAPGRYKGVHIVNDSLTFKAAWFVLKQCLSKKLKQRFHFHSSPDTLQDYFPRSILPSDFGGDLEDYDQTEWLRKVMSPEQLSRMGGGCLKHLNYPQ